MALIDLNDLKSCFQKSLLVSYLTRIWSMKTAIFSIQSSFVCLFASWQPRAGRFISVIKYNFTAPDLNWMQTNKQTKEGIMTWKLYFFIFNILTLIQICYKPHWFSNSRYHGTSSRYLSTLQGRMPGHILFCHHKGTSRWSTSWEYSKHGALREVFPGSSSKAIPDSGAPQGRQCSPLDTNPNSAVPY